MCCRPINRVPQDHIIENLHFLTLLILQQCTCSCVMVSLASFSSFLHRSTSRCASRSCTSRPSYTRTESHE